MTQPYIETDPTALAGPTVKMPALFIGHGNPMNALDDTEFSRAWAGLGRALPRPKAVLCISAHWETLGTQVTTMENPRTLHDFSGFPKALFEVDYPAPGDPGLARLIQETVSDTPVSLDFGWGMDHGAWSILCRMFPQADVPVLQLSLDRTKTPRQHYQLGKALRVLRRQGVLVMGSGNLVHHLGKLVWQDTAHEWAVDFDEAIKRLILAGDHASIIHYPPIGRGGAAFRADPRALPAAPLHLRAARGRGGTPLLD